MPPSVPMVFVACVIAAMEIGELVTYQGHAYVLRGLDPMGVLDRSAELEDPETGECVSVPLAEVSPREP